MKAHLTGCLQKVQLALARLAVTAGRMPRRHVLVAVAVAVVWGVNFVVIHVGLRALPAAAVRRAALLPGRARAPVRPPPGRARPLRDRRRRRSSRPASSACCSSAWTTACRAGLASLVLQLQAAFTVGLAVLLLGRAARAGAARRRRARAGRHRDHRRRPRRGRPARRARADRRRRRLVGRRQRRHPQGALAAPARPARVVEPRRRRSRCSPLSLLTERRQRRSRSTPAGVLALLYVVVLSTLGRLRRLGVAAGPAPGLRRSRRSRCSCRSSGIARGLDRARRGADRPGADRRRVVLGGLALTVGLTAPRRARAAGLPGRAPLPQPQR